MTNNEFGGMLNHTQQPHSWNSVLYDTVVGEIIWIRRARILVWAG